MSEPERIRSRASRRSRAAGALAVAAALLSVPTSAAPTGTRIVAVFRAADCGGDGCEPGSDPALREGVAVRGAIEVHVGSRSDLIGLEMVRLQARIGNDPRWICVQQWEPQGSRDFTASYAWDTVRWPAPGPGWGCPETTPHYHGEPTRAGTAALRVEAREIGDDARSFSAEFDLLLLNPPAAPEWLQPPYESAGEVVLRWRANGEPDITEYRIRRTGGAGRATIVVDARDPQESGCVPFGKDSLECRDGAGSEGTARYRLEALRRVPSGGDVPCRATRGRCLVSAASAVHAIDLAAGSGAEPSPSASASESASPSASATPTSTEPAHAVPTATASSTASGRAAPPVDPQPAGRRSSLPLVPGSVLVLIAAALLVLRIRQGAGPRPQK